MTDVNLITALAEELGFEVEPTQFHRNSFVVSRESRNPSYRTEYCNMSISGESINLVGQEDHYILLADPSSLDQISNVLETPNFLLGSYKPRGVSASRLLGALDE